MLDLLREVGALVLDENKGSASVAVAVAKLKNPEIAEALKAEYSATPPPPRMYADDFPDEDTRAAAIAQVQNAELRWNLEQFATLGPCLAEIERSVLNVPASESLRILRKKAVAHYDLIRDGDGWRTLRIQDIKLTYEELDDYVDACTSAVDKLYHLVLRTSYDWEGGDGIAQKYAAEYVEALALGLEQQRRQREEKRERMLKELRDLQERNRPQVSEPE